MNNALVVVDMAYDFIDGSLACKEAEKAVAETLKFIDSQTHGQGGEEHEILDTFPILFVCDRNRIHDDLKPYVVEELTFVKGINNADQTVGEILELLDTTDVHVCAIAEESCVRQTCDDLLKAGFKVHLHSDCLAYLDQDSLEKSLEEMKAEGIIIE